VSVVLERMAQQRAGTESQGLAFGSNADSANGLRNNAVGAPDEQSHRMVLIGLAHSPRHVRFTANQVANHLEAAQKCAMEAREKEKKPVASETGVCDPRTYAAAILAYLRCGNDVNNAAGVLNRHLLANGLPVPFAVWERLVEGYDEYFRGKSTQTFGESKENYWTAREGAMMKIWRWMQRAESCQPFSESSSYVAMRWRQTVTLMATSLKRPENVESVFEAALSWKCFSIMEDSHPHFHTDRDLVMEHLANLLLRDRRLEDALALFAKHLRNPLLLPVFTRHAAAARRAGDDLLAKRLREFAKQHSLALPLSLSHPLNVAKSKS